MFTFNHRTKLGTHAANYFSPCFHEFSNRTVRQLALPESEDSWSLRLLAVTFART